MCAACALETNQISSMGKVNRPHRMEKGMRSQSGRPTLAICALDNIIPKI